MATWSISVSCGAVMPQRCHDDRGDRRTAASSDRVALVSVAEAAADLDEQLVGHARLTAQQRPEVEGGDAEGLDVAGRQHRGGTGPLVDQRDLAEALARAE